MGAYDIPNIQIASSGTDSGAVAADPHFQQADGISIEAPDTLTGTVTVQVSHDGGSSFSDYQDPDSGSDVTVPAGSVAYVKYTGFDQLRVQSGSSEGSARTFTLKGIEDSRRKMKAL